LLYKLTTFLVLLLEPTDQNAEIGIEVRKRLDWWYSWNLFTL